MNLEIVKFEPVQYERKFREFDSRGRSWAVGWSETPAGQSRVYVTVEGESFWDDFANRTTRPHTLWRPLVLQALKENGVEFKSIRWSNKAGCKMCPCSPGFIIQGHPYPARDYWLTLKMDEPATTDQTEANFRALQILADPTMPVGDEEQKAAAREALGR